VASLFPCVDTFIDEFEKLLPCEREKVLGEMAAFLTAYHEGREEAFADSEDEPRVLSEASAHTLAEMMNYFGVRPNGPLARVIASTRKLLS